MTPATPAASGPPARRPADPRRAPEPTGAPARSDAAGRGAPDRATTPRIRWRRIPGRVILAICFVLGAAALAAMVLPFSAVNPEGIDLRCGPAVFEVLMPPDPAFADVPENVGCADPARTRLLIAGGALVLVLLIVAITDWRTRRGSVQRDSRWLASSGRRGRGQGRGRASSRSASKRQRPSDPSPSSAADPSIGPSGRDTSSTRASLPAPRR